MNNQSINFLEEIKRCDLATRVSKVTDGELLVIIWEELENGEWSEDGEYSVG